VTHIPREAASRRSLKNMPRGIWVLGLVSLFMDVSSEMIHALLPLYLVTVLGASTLVVGFIEGIAEAAAMIVKIFSGVLSDWLGKRKLLTAVGMGSPLSPSRFFRSQPASAGSSRRASLIASARASAEPRATR
jgi:Na+/melibiose symporter-like transporter